MNKEELGQIVHSLKELERKQNAAEQAKAESRQAEEAQNKAREARRESLRQILYGPNSRPLTFIVPQDSKLTEENGIYKPQVLPIFHLTLPSRI